jgi:hypothetical protein
MDGLPEDPTQILLAEYAALRAETERRATVQWHIFALQVTSAGAITSLAIAAAGTVALLLLVPFVSYMLGNRYLLHDAHLKLIRTYIRDSLSSRLSGHLQWEGWRDQELVPVVARQRWFTATGWNALHPTRLAFQGIAALAVISALGAGIFLWITRSPSWYAITAFGLFWLLGAVATARLHHSFDRAA